MYKGSVDCKVVEGSNGKIIYVPNNYFQPLDLLTSAPKILFILARKPDIKMNSYNEREKGKKAQEIKLSVIKPLHAKWVVQFYYHILTEKKSKA